MTPARRCWATSIPGQAIEHERHITIGVKERNMLHWLMARQLFILGQDPPELARSEGVGLDELAEEFSEDLRLMMDIGFEVEDDRETVDLTTPAESLVKTIRRLRRDARRAPSEPPREHDPQGDDEGRWQRFREAVGVCDEVLDLLDSPHRGEPEEANATECSAPGTAFGLSPVRPPAIIVLAAVERAARHERSDEVATATVVEHLGFDPTKKTNRMLHHRLDGLRDAGSLTRIARDGADTWLLTSEGREGPDRRYEAEEVGELPEAPQHRAWREARVEAAVRPRDRAAHRGISSVVAWLGSSLLPGRNPGFWVSVKPGLAQGKQFC